MPARLALSALTGIAALIAASPALADAVTYQGTLGKAAIVLELSAPIGTAGAKIVGRYLYRIKGIDIPLDAVSGSAGKLDLAEEKACTEDICESGSDASAPVGPKWHLVASSDGGSLSGTWSDAGKSLPLSLARVGTRALKDDFDGTPAGLAAIVDDIDDGQTKLTATISPYDFQRMQATQTQGAVTHAGETAYTYDTDPRTRFAFPRIVAAGNTDIGAANTFLQQRHWQYNAAAFSCGAEAYLGLGWNDIAGNSTDSLGDWPDESIKVTYLSPTLMSWDESGSLFCGGAHPDNHDDPATLDLRTGKLVDMSLIVKGWVPTSAIDGTSPTDLVSARAKPDGYLWGPDQSLVDFVVAHLPKSDDPEDECGNAESIQESLSISFVTGDKLRFGLSGMPTVASSCNGKLFDLSLHEAAAVLTPEAADFFPSLKSK